MLSHKDLSESQYNQIINIIQKSCSESYLFEIPQQKIVKSFSVLSNERKFLCTYLFCGKLILGNIDFDSITGRKIRRTLKIFEHINKI